MFLKKIACSCFVALLNEMNADHARGLGVDDGDNELTENAEGDEALLGIVEAIVFVGISGSLKDSWRVDEVEAVLFDIQLALRITPCEPHGAIVYTLRLCVKVALAAA